MDKIKKQLKGIELAKEIDSIEQQMPLYLKSQKLLAESYYAYFQMLMEEGFNEYQALEIIKARGTK